MTITSIYEKTFSGIARIQEQYSIKYCLIEKKDEEKDTYGIKLISKMNSSAHYKLIPDISDVREEVIDILTFLYENSVETDIAEEVVHDVLA